MVIHIALVGRNSGHLWNGLKEIIPAEKMYLLHSPNQDDFKHADEAKKLKKEIEKRFCKTILVTINPFEMSNTINTIDEIVSKEIKDSNHELMTIDFAVGVTGGTNIMASGATIGAMLIGTQAYYVHDDRKPPKRKRYTELLPIPPINILRSLIDSRQKILQVLEKGVFEFRGEKEQGVMKNKDLEKKLGMRPSTLNSALQSLQAKGFVETTRGVPVIKFKQVDLNQKPVEVVVKLKNQILVKITELGKVQAKKASMKT